MFQNLSTRLACVVGAETHPGKVRDHNEDHHLVDPELGLYAVCDGMGGHQAGEVASEIAARLIHQTVTRQPSAGQVRPDEVLVKSLGAAHNAIVDAANADPARLGMGTTAVVVWIPEPGDEAWVAHVGDSRAYLWRDGQLQRLTEDHTWLNRMKRAGALPASPDDWPNRHTLSQALGGRTPPVPDSRQVTLQAGDVLLLCSDGLTDMLDDAAIAGMLATPAGPHGLVRSLIAEANRQGGEDNITAVVIRITRPGEPSG